MDETNGKLNSLREDLTNVFSIDQPESEEVGSVTNVNSMSKRTFFILKRWVLKILQKNFGKENSSK